MGLLRNKLLGFSKSLRGSNQDHAEMPIRAEFAPIERRVRGRIPEKRSHIEDLGTLTGGKLQLVLGGGTSSGATVNERTALNVAAITACVSFIADMVAKLPIYLYRDNESGPQEITNHPGARLIRRFPSGMHTSFELRQLMETGKGIGGNGYARVYRDGLGDPRAIQWLKPCDVQPRLVKSPSGEDSVAYYVEGLSEPLTRHNIIHVRWGLSEDGFTGQSPIRLLRESIGISMTQTAAAGTLMKNGAKFPGILSSETIHKKETIDAAREEWEKNTTGVNLNRTPIINGSFKYQTTSGMSMVDAQFLESRRFELQEIARFYRIPPFMIGDSTASTTWGTGIEQQTLGFLNFCLDSHLIGWEESLGHTLLTTQEQNDGVYFRFDRDQLANVSLEARAKFYQALRTCGAMSPNDIRKKENEPLISKEDGGDSYANPNTSAPGRPEPAPKPEPEPAEA